NELAEWAMPRFFVRKDVWGGYNPVSERGTKYEKGDGTIGEVPKSVTRPPKKKPGKGSLTLNEVRRHLRVRAAEDVIGRPQYQPRESLPLVCARHRRTRG